MWSSVSEITSLYIRQPRLCSSAARLNLAVAYILCYIHYFLETSHFFLLNFKRCSCIEIKHGPLLHTCHNIDTGPAVSILVSSNLCVDTLSYRCIEHSTIRWLNWNFYANFPDTCDQRLLMQCSNVEILMQWADLDKFFTWVCFECMKLLHSVPFHSLNFDLLWLVFYWFTEVCWRTIGINYQLFYLILPL